MIENDLIERAAHFAVNAHSGMVRKNGSPYILHPFETAAIIGTMTNDECVIAAGLLHDVVEDTPHTADEILENFGERVAELVAMETENKREETPAQDTWEMRKKESLEELKNCDDIGVKMLWLGDKLSNMRSFSRLYDEKGSELWKSFNNSDPERQEWFYRTISECLSELKDTAAWKEYNYLLNKVFRKKQIRSTP